MKIQRLQVTIQPWHAHPMQEMATKEIRVEVVANNNAYTSVAYMTEDDLQSTFDMLMDIAKREILAAMKK